MHVPSFREMIMFCMTEEADSSQDVPSPNVESNENQQCLQNDFCQQSVSDPAETHDEDPEDLKFPSQTINPTSAPPVHNNAMLVDLQILPDSSSGAFSSLQEPEQPPKVKVQYLEKKREAARAAREFRRKKNDYLRRLERREIDLQKKNKTLLEEIEALKELNVIKHLFR